MTDVPRWRAVWLASATTELRRWSRHRAAVASALLLPIVMATLLTLALGNDATRLAVRIVVVDGDGGPAGEAFTRDILGDPDVREVVEVVRMAGTEAEARRMVDEGEADAGIVIGEGLSAALASIGDPGRRSELPGIDVLRSDDQPLAGDIAHLLVDQFESRSRATAVTLSRTGSAPAEPWPLRVVLTAPDGVPLDGARHAGPSVGMFSVLMTVGFVAYRLLLDRQTGVVERLASAPIARSAVLLGRATAALVLGALSLGALVVTMQGVLGRSWGPPLPLMVVIGALLIAMAGIGALIGALARTPGEVQTFSLGLAFVFALASGQFGRGAPPAFADWLPTSHALDAFALLATESADLTMVLPQISALLAFGIGASAVAVACSRRFV